MDANNNVYQLFNGSAAYDLNRYSGNTAPEIQSPGLPEERIAPQKYKRVKVKAAVAPTALLGLMVVTCMLILVIFGYVQLYEATERVSKLENELSSLMQQQVILESLYEGGIDLEYIEERAGELGFSVPTKDQTVYLNLSGSDKAEIYHTEHSNFIQRVVQAIRSSAGGLVEYLS